MPQNCRLSRSRDYDTRTSGHETRNLVKRLESWVAAEKIRHLVGLTTEDRLDGRRSNLCDADRRLSGAVCNPRRGDPKKIVGSLDSPCGKDEHHTPQVMTAP